MLSEGKFGVENVFSLKDGKSESFYYDDKEAELPQVPSHSISIERHMKGLD
jgi:hypothetical protein